MGNVMNLFEENVLRPVRGGSSHKKSPKQKVKIVRSEKAGDVAKPKQRFSFFKNKKEDKPKEVKIKSDVKTVKTFTKGGDKTTTYKSDPNSGRTVTTKKTVITVDKDGNRTETTTTVVSSGGNKGSNVDEMINKFNSFK